MAPFATVAQLEAFWKQLDATDEARAAVLLELASNRLRVIASNVGVDIDAKVAASAAYGAVAGWVVMEATKRAMLTPVDAAPANSIQQSAGPYSENIVFTNPAGDLWFKKAELHDLGLHGNQRLNSISTVPGNDIYGDYESS